MGEKRVTQQVASDEIYNDDWFLKDSVLHDTTKVQPSVIKEYVNQGMATSQNLADEATARQNMDNQLASGISKQMSNLADFYDTTTSYVVGDVVMQQSGDLLRCIAPTSGAFDNTKWEQVTVDELFDDLNFSADAISYDNTSSGLEADNVQDAIGETITKLSAVGTASGDIATFPDGSDLPMPKLEVAIEPVQEGSGDPSPENIRPIIGWDEVNVSVCGTNVWDEETRNGYYNTDGSFTSYSSNIANKNPIFVKSGVTYRFECLSANFGRICWYDKDKMFISTQVVQNRNISITAPSNACWLNFDMVGAYGTTYNNDISINYPSTDTSYHAYNGQTYTIDLDGTRYGGKVDLVSGVMTVDRVGVNVISQEKNSWQVGTLSCCYRINLPTASTTVASSEKHGAISNMLLEEVAYVGTSRPNEYGENKFAISTSGIILAIYDTDLTLTEEQFKTKYNDLFVVYPLATPLTIQLTPTVVKSLRGLNNVYADCGAILDAEYIRDLTIVLSNINIGGGKMDLLASSNSVYYNQETNISLSKSMSNYDVLMFECNYYDGTAVPSAILSVDLLRSLINSRYGYVCYTPGYCDIGYVNDTTIYCRRVANVGIKKIYGIKY